MERLGALVSDPASDPVDAEVTGHQQRPGRFDPHQFDVHRRSGTHLAGKDPGEGARTHVDPMGEGAHREVLVQMGREPRQQIPECGVADVLSSQRGGELRLTTRTPGEDDQPAGDLLGEVVVMVLSHHRQGEVDPRGHTGGAPDIAVGHEDLVVVDLHQREVRTQGIAGGPVGGDRASVEQAAGGQDERAGAHRCHTPGAQAQRTDLPHHRIVGGQTVRTRTADHHQGVHRFTRSHLLGEGPRDRQGHTGAAHDVAAVRRYQHSFIGAVRT